MKHIFIIIALIVTTTIKAQTVNEITAESNVNHVVLYLDGAELSHQQTIDLKKGRNLVIFNNITPQIVESSIRVKTEDNLSVLALTNKPQNQKKEKLLPDIKRVNDSLLILEAKNQLLDDEATALKIEKDLLMKNITIGGQNNGVPIEELKNAATFYRSRIFEINKRLSAIKISFDQHKESMNLLIVRKNELDQKIYIKRSSIHILLDVPENKKSNIQLQYLVQTAGWSPAYDISAKDINTEVELIYRANVFNNTDINWDNLNITLSTANPWQSASKPEMKPWYLNFENMQYNLTKKQNYQNNNRLEIGQGYAENMITQDLYTQNEKPNSYEEIDVIDLNIEFILNKKYSIPADNKPYIVDVTTHQLPALFKYFTIPKIDKDAFLLAQITGWEDLNLVEGEANIYFGGAYVGKSYINTRNVKDTLDISFGRDKKIMVTRSKLTNFSSTKMVGGKRKEVFAYRIVVKNNRKQTIDIEIKDQIPVSQDSEIEVGSEEITGGQYIETTGELEWKFKIDPGNSETIDLKYFVKYPKNKVVEIKQSQKRSVRKF